VIVRIQKTDSIFFGLSKTNEYRDTAKPFSVVANCRDGKERHFFLSRIELKKLLKQGERALARKPTRLKKAK